MKKLVFIIVIFTLALGIWYGESRKIYDLGNGEYLTVWKTYNNTCYIIPGKYYKLLKPFDNYIQTTNDQYLMIYFPNKGNRSLIVRNQGTFGGSKGGYSIVNNSKEDFKIIPYSGKVEENLYKSGATLISDVKQNISYLDINIKENYAMNQHGNRL
ncbi:hypothetical protein DBR40_00955 [Pedobacter sp. KBW01]|uniref:hypothetical protein n=1 Tax=Pedobacter sp. KBW01 TaxID=2153364 RepID=UPI000F59B7D7|nr:hypothetical protein [Pedobacter sp. KBW01]RQO80218.1 hypothetical protein DBR40_00955 [Pedobacter sp. KBW01]